MYSRTATVALVASLLIVSWSAGAATAADETAAPVPVLPQTLNASEFDLETCAGQVVLLDFWASWCGPCRQSLPWLSQLQDRYADQGLRVIAVNVDKDARAASAMMAGLDPRILVVMDSKGDLAARYELEGMPSSFLIGPDGKIMASHVGFLASEAAEREAEVAALLRTVAEGKEP